MLTHAMLPHVTQSKDSPPPATYDDVLNAPEHMVAELIDGVLYTSPRPTLAHSVSGTTLLIVIGSHFHQGGGGPGGWWILDEPELHFGHDVLVPDCAGWRQDRMPDAPKAAFSTLAPDWLCEVLSPSTENLDRSKKLDVYARQRIPYVWLVNPNTKTLEVLKLEAGRWEILGVHGAHERVRARPFDAIEIELAYLWGERPSS